MQLLHYLRVRLEVKLLVNSLSMLEVVKVYMILNVLNETPDMPLLLHKSSALMLVPRKPGRVTLLNIFQGRDKATYSMNSFVAVSCLRATHRSTWFLRVLSLHTFFG